MNSAIINALKPTAAISLVLLALLWFTSDNTAMFVSELKAGGAFLLLMLVLILIGKALQWLLRFVNRLKRPRKHVPRPPQYHDGFDHPV